MRIAVDAMGGDNAPEAIVKGSELSIQTNDTEIVLVGDEARIKSIIQPKSLATGQITVHHAGEVVEMDEHASSIRTKKDASVVVCASLVKEGRADAMVSVGNTAAAMATATLKFSRIQGIDRPAIATIFPGRNNPTVLLDAGAVADCDVDNMVQFAVMGGSYATKVLGVENPRVGLLSIGGEECKGNELTKLAHAAFRQLPLNFVGNIEGNYLMDGKCDVLVADGFTGNVVLKVAEGIWEFLQANIGAELSASPDIAEMFSPLMKRVQKKVDYSEYGGAPLLGLNGICIIGHGRSNPQAVANAVKAATTAVSSDLVETIRNTMQQMKTRSASIGDSV